MAWPRLILAVAAVAVVAGCGTPAKIQIDSEPQGAEIFVDGERAANTTPPGALTPAEVTIPDPPGEHIIVLKKSGYVDSKALVTTKRSPNAYAPLEPHGGCNPGRTCLFPPLFCVDFVGNLSDAYSTETRPSNLRFVLQPKGQGLIVWTWFSPISVYFDGGLVGVLNYSGSELPAELVISVAEPGSHILELKKDGFEDRKETVQIEKDCFRSVEGRPGKFKETQESK